MMYKKYFKQFVKELDNKMKVGYNEYGDKSFSRSPVELIQELEQEVIDISGWGMILYVRLEEMKRAIKGVK